MRRFYDYSLRVNKVRILRISILIFLVILTVYLTKKKPLPLVFPSTYVNPICNTSCLNLNSSDWVHSSYKLDLFASNFVSKGECYTTNYVWPTYDDWPEVLAKQSINTYFDTTESTFGVGSIGSKTVGYSLSTCPENATFRSSETIEVQDWIRQAQFPTDCKAASFLVVEKFHNSGLGSSLHMLLYPFSQALLRGQVFIPPRDWLWGRCKTRNLDCYFESVTNCSDPKDTGSSSVTIFDSKSRIGSHNLALPLRWSHKDWNWWRAQLMAYIFRPKKDFLDHVLLPAISAQFPSGIERPFASVFIRAGDKAQEAQIFTPGAYLKLLLPLAKQLHTKSVYINSDTQAVLDDARNLFTQFGFNVYSLNMRRSFIHSHLKYFSDAAFAELTTMSLADIFIQLAGDIFAGTSSSNWCRLVDELRMVRGKFAAPWIDPGGHPLVEY